MLPESVGSLLLLGSVLTLGSVLAGFVAGLFAAPAFQKRSLAKAFRDANRWQSRLLDHLRSTQQLCERAISAQARSQWPAGTAVHLKTIRERLCDSLQQLGTSVADCGGGPGSKDLSTPPPVAIPLKIRWPQEPNDLQSGLPGNSAYEKSLAAMLAATARKNSLSSLLLLRIDRYESLRQRLAADELVQQIRKVATLAMRHLRDDDLLCHPQPDLLAILMPGLASQSGWQTAGTIRDAIRNHRFLLHDGSEIIITASSGYTTCQGNDHPTLTTDRALAALRKAQDQGRNRLQTLDARLQDAAIHSDRSLSLTDSSDSAHLLLNRP